MVAHVNVFAPIRRLVLPGDPDFEWPDPGSRRWEGRLSPEWWQRPMWRALFGDWPIPERGHVYLFGPNGVAGSMYEPWNVPAIGGIGMFWAINGGNGGGGGRTDVASTARTGGGGGGSAPHGRAAFALATLPGVLHARAAAGGAGGAANSNGTAGNLFSDWCVYPSAGSNSNGTDTLVLGGGVGGGGVAGATSAGAVAGGGGGSAGGTTVWALLLSLAVTGAGGITGGVSAGGNGAPAANVQLFVTTIFHPGLGGGAVTAANAETIGGGYTQATPPGWPPPGGAIGGGNGSSGITNWPWVHRGVDPWYHTGGTGGGGNASGTGGKGGDGAWGCGGGGGGAGTTGGAGGRGGDGFCLAITS